MTSKYGLNVKDLPHNIGTRPYIYYGHNVKLLFNQSNKNNLNIVMFRDPLSFILSRAQHQYRADSIARSTSLLRDIRLYGDDYFKFITRSDISQISPILSNWHKTSITTKSMVNTILDSIFHNQLLVKCRTS